MRIYLIGFMGCGKSHWGKALSEKLRIPFFDLDEQIVAHQGKPIVQLFAEHGEEYFRMVEKEVLYLISESHETFVMATGGGTPCFFNNIDYLKRMGTAVWLHCSPDCLHSRLLREREHRPLIRSLTDEQLRSFIARKYSDRRIFYRQAQVALQEEGLELDTLISQIFHH